MAIPVAITQMVGGDCLPYADLVLGGRGKDVRGRRRIAAACFSRISGIRHVRRQYYSIGN
jgi:hypothetical protein